MCNLVCPIEIRAPLLGLVSLQGNLEPKKKEKGTTGLPSQNTNDVVPRLL